MTSTDTTATPTATSPTALSFQEKVNAFFAHLKSDVEWVEADLIAIAQNIEAGAEMALADLQGALGFLGTHIGQVATTVTAVESGINAMNAAGVKVPAELTNAVTAVAQATAGVTAALNNEAVNANASVALTDGYKATKALQVAAGAAASIMATIPGVTLPATPPPPAP